ncbi:WD40-repeat-containing domain protein, partial [Fusarium redolens]
FLPDSQHLASALSNKAVNIWDTITGHCEAMLEGHSFPVNSVAFSPDSQHLASANSWTTKIWDARTGGCQATLELDMNEEDEYVFQFDKTGARLHMNIGTFDLSLLSSSPPAALRASSLRHHLRQCQGYGISVDRLWITYEAQNLLWLPPEYHPVALAIVASTVVLGCKSGLVLLFRFSETATR